MRMCPRCSGWLNKHQNTRCPECLFDLTSQDVHYIEVFGIEACNVEEEEEPYEDDECK